MLSLIVAHDSDFVIGYKGWMPWSLKEDLQVFKTITLNHTIVMGRTTFEGMKKPLPNRKTIVVTKDKNYAFDHQDVIVSYDLDEIVEQFQNSEEEIIICGGAQIYKAALPYVKKMYISLVDGIHEADTYFPEYDINDFNILKRVPYDGFCFLELERKEL